MENSSASKNQLSVPVSIVVAGALIALAIYFSRGSGSTLTQTQTATETQTPSTEEIKVADITANDHLLGNPAAPLAVVVYTDLECPYCKIFHTTMHTIADTYGKDGKVLWVYRDFPLAQLHPKAPKEAEAAECVAGLGGNKAFWDYVDKIFQITPSNNGLDPAELPKIAAQIGIDQNAFTACLSSGKNGTKVQTEYTEAVNAGGRGTPFSVIVSKTPISDAALEALANSTASLPADTITLSTDRLRLGISGALPLSLIQQILDSLLSNS